MADNTVLDRLNAAIEACDLAGVRACFTPDAQVWHGYDCVAHDLESFLASIEPIFAAGVEIRYDDVRRQPTPGGFVQQYLVVTPAADGGWSAKPCCSVFHLKDGLIHRAQEYLDRTGVVTAETRPMATPGI